MLILTDNYFHRLRRALVGANKSLRIMAYVINFHFYKHFYSSTWVFDQILRLHRQGVPLKIILDSSPSYSHNHTANLFTTKRLLENGITVKMQTTKKPLHSKLIIVDDSLAIAGSHNLTEGSLTSKYELSFEFIDPYSVGQLIRYFDSIYDSPNTAPWERRWWPKAKTKISPSQTPSIT